MHLYFLEKAKKSPTINKAAGTAIAISSVIFVLLFLIQIFLIIISYSVKPDRPIPSGAETVFIFILISKLMTLGIVIYQRLFRDKSFLEEIFDISDTSFQSHCLRILYLLFSLYLYYLIIEAYSLCSQLHRSSFSEKVT